MRFFDITCKLGTMRKAAEFTIYPLNPSTPDIVQIQSDKRIARVQLSTGKCLLSDGKGGHPGHMKLSPALGAVVVDMPADVLGQLKEQIARMECRRIADGVEPGAARVT